MIFFILACTGNKDTGSIVDVDSDSAVEPVETESFDLSLDVMISHLEELQDIATDNSNNRSVGSSGGALTRAYIIGTLEGWGYEVTTQPVPISYFRENRDAILTVDNQQLNASTFVYSASGIATSVVEGVDLQIPPGASSNSSTSGCDELDFENFNAGNIALIQRGTCNFSVKAVNAQNAGAVGVIIFNEGQSGRTDVVEGMLDETGSTIPVVGVSFASGESLSSFQGQVTIDVDAERTTLETENIFAELPAAELDSVVLVGAHLDSVVAGPGINDNGSGSSMLLAMAQWFVDNPLDMDHNIRFAWWSAEEIGLIGSQYYVDNATNLNEIEYYLNFDMVASPNYVPFIYDGNGDQLGLQGPSGSAQIEETFEAHFSDRGLPFTGTPFDGRSDYGPFVEVGIASGGLFTGAESIKSESESTLYGGTSGVAYDACYHQACDTIENINAQALQEMGNAALNVTIELASGTRIRPATQHSQIQFDYQGEWLKR